MISTKNRTYRVIMLIASLVLPAALLIAYLIMPAILASMRPDLDNMSIMVVFGFFMIGDTIGTVIGIIVVILVIELNDRQHDRECQFCQLHDLYKQPGNQHDINEKSNV